MMRRSNFDLRERERLAQLQAKVEVLSIGFLGNRMRLKHRGDFAVLGEEMNGRYYK